MVHRFGTLGAKSAARLPVKVDTIAPRVTARDQLTASARRAPPYRRLPLSNPKSFYPTFMPAFVEPFSDAIKMPQLYFRGLPVIPDLGVRPSDAGQGNMYQVVQPRKIDRAETAPQAVRRARKGATEPFATAPAQRTAHVSRALLADAQQESGGMPASAPRAQTLYAGQRDPGSYWLSHRGLLCLGFGGAVPPEILWFFRRPCSTIADCGPDEYARECSANADAVCAKCSIDVDCGDGKYWAACSKTADGVKICIHLPTVIAKKFPTKHTVRTAWPDCCEAALPTAVTDMHCNLCRAQGNAFPVLSGCAPSISTGQSAPGLLTVPARHARRAAVQVRVSHAHVL